MGVRNPASGPVGVRHLVEHRSDPDHHLRQRGDVVEGDGVEDDADVGVREREPAGCRVRRVVVDLEYAGHGLLLEPLGGVARGDPRRSSQVADRAPRPLVQGGVQAEPVAQIDAEQLEGAGRRVKYALIEARVGSGHGKSPICGCGYSGRGRFDLPMGGPTFRRWG